MSDFRIELAQPLAAAPDEPHGIRIRADSFVFTKLVRPGDQASDEYLYAPPSALAWWLIEHWWRLRWESVPSGRPSSAWRLAHELSAIGQGYAWPRLQIWGEGGRVGLACFRDPDTILGPVRFVTTAVLFLSGEKFEAGVDEFLELTSDAGAGSVASWRQLSEHITVLRAERQDPAIAEWRRLEARLGYNPDEAPDALMEELGAYVTRYGSDGVEEAVQAAPGPSAADTLGRELAAATKQTRCDFHDAVLAAGHVHLDPGMPQWKPAEEAAIALRQTMAVSGPMNDARLSELLKTRPEVLEGASPGDSRRLAYGLRLSGISDRDTRSDGQPDRVAFATRARCDRRFELSRALGDAVFSGDDPLGPIARTKTARQKFQRAFAQTLLCPFDELMSFLDTDNPSGKAITAAAEHFEVAPRVVQSVLVNKHVIARQRFEDLIEAA